MSGELSPGFMVVHGNRPETLRALMAQWMQAASLGPLEDEAVLVQSNGVAQWIKLHLASDASRGGLGIAAALQVQLPSQFTWRAYRALLGAAQVPADSPFDKSRLVWRLMRLLPGLLAEPVFQPLERFLRGGEGGAADPRKLHQLCERVADLFDQYQVYRADWLEAWASGRDRIAVRGAEQPLDASDAWQPALWRVLRQDAGEAAAHGSRAEVHQRFLRAAAQPDAQRPRGLPRRITVIGVSSLPAQALQVLAALARWSQVLVFVHNPCRHDWSRIVPDHELLRARRHRQAPRGPVAGLPAPGHPLLAAWGRQGRDFIRMLDEHDEHEAHARRFEAVLRQVDVFEANADAGSRSLLHRLQDDMLELRPVEESRQLAPEVAAGDRSIAFHVTHGPLREVEVLHDRLLAAFAADPELRPQDVMVMVPDVAAFAPHIEAVFGLYERDDPRHIPFGIADRGQRGHDSLLAAIAKLLSLPQARWAASELLDLLDVPAFRRRLGIQEAELPLLRRWVARAEVRWGLNAPQREHLGLPPGLDQNSWQFGLRRMFLGYAVGSGEPWQGIAPMDEIGGLDAALLGPLATLLDRLDAHWHALTEDAAPDRWVERLERLLDDFFEAPDGSDESLVLLRLRGALHAWQQECAEAGLVDALPLAVVGGHWLDRVERPSLSQLFLSGGVTFASLMPMRAIPFRWIALLGMNDGDYPRPRTPIDFDLMAREVRPGDRSRREDDRYLFLEALLSAREHLHVSWVGRSIRDNQERPASVLVAQLRDHVAACWRRAGDARPQALAGPALLQALTCEHRLQPFHEAYFDGRDPRLASYAREWRVAREATTLAQPPQPLPAPAGERVFTLREFAAFAREPVRFFFDQRLQVHFGHDDPVAEDQEPFELDPLRRWQLQDELIRLQKTAIEHGADREAALARGLDVMTARGSLPVGALAAPVRATLAEPMERLFAEHAAACEQWPQRLPDEWLDHAPADLAQAPRVQDWLGELRTDGQGARCRLVLESTGLIRKATGKDTDQWRFDKLVGHWVAHLAGHLGGQPMTSVVASKAGTLTLLPLSIEVARGHWRDLCVLLAEGLCRPLPFALRSASEWLEKLPKGEETAREAARRCYEEHEPRRHQFAEARRDPCLGRTYPGFDALWSDGEFARLAQRLLGPLREAPRNKPRGERG
ncbi:exodeoxyribonuclease V subunit gamma [Ramlibacter sp. AW1]|uniref:RecBCD enzyme subunit RecC n=1 Tax=Ramlibacter aurantiacus TaxID=2801330 RepID=A0A936ZFF5_9BURK|nr:exodeoxyribonuclease V subunit gamma [Ramlibacter aurantiacus]MBL0419937.1 exodeoxyribonuclease V subunit gamma [Ramlibacter aurantiacus]